MLPTEHPTGERARRPDPAAPPEAPGPSGRRGCWGTVISGGFGCLAFLVGAALAIAVAAPQLLSGRAADVIEARLEARIAGDVEIGDLELHWRERQRARDVTIQTLATEEDGKQRSLAEFSLRFPSLFDLLAGPSTEWDFKITDAKFTARVDADGTSDLGRCLGLEKVDERGEIIALLGALAEVAGATDTVESERRSVRTGVNSSSIRFIDMASGAGTDRREATLSGFVLTTTKSRVGFQLELKDAIVEYGARERETSKVFLKLNFGSLGAPGSSDALPRATTGLQTAKLVADPIPMETLRLMGLSPRRGSPPGVKPRRLASAADFYVPMAAGLDEGIRAFLKDGASLDVSYGPDASDDAGEGGAARRLELRAASPIGDVKLLALHDGTRLIGARSRTGEPALDAGFRLAPGTLRSIMGALLPPEGVEVREQDIDANWNLQSDRFQVPLGAHDLSTDAFFGAYFGALLGDARADSSGGAGSETPLARGGLRRQRFARALRRADAELNLHSPGAKPARVVFLPSDPERQSGYDQLGLIHRLTRVNFLGELGASVNSTWGVEQSVESADLRLTIPGAALMPGDVLSPLLDVSRVPEVPLALIQSVVQLPDELAALLPRRLERLKLTGLPLAHLLSAKGAPRRPIDAPIPLVATLEGSDRVEGIYERGTVTIPKATLKVPLDEFFGERVIMGYMPWFEAVEPSASGSLALELRDFSFSMGEEDFKQNGEVILSSSPLRVRLLREIANKLKAVDEDGAAPESAEGGFVTWTPRAVFTLDGLRVGYEGIELPLSDHHVITLDGSYYRGDGNFSLGGLVDSQFIQGPDEGGVLWRIAIQGTASGDERTAQVTFDPGTLDLKVLTDFMRKAAELGDKAK